MLMGQAAGVAAALAAERDVSPRRLDVKALQRELLRLGAEFGTPERVEELLGRSGDEGTDGQPST